MTHKYEYPDRLALEKRVLKLMRKWIPRMDLEHIYISNVFVDGARGEDGGEIEATAAVTQAEWEYRKACITWYLPSVAAMSDEGLEDTVIHELCHVLLAPIKEAMKANTIKVEELATENVARAIKAANRG